MDWCTPRGRGAGTPVAASPYRRAGTPRGTPGPVTLCFTERLYLKAGRRLDAEFLALTWRRRCNSLKCWLGCSCRSARGGRGAAAAAGISMRSRFSRGSLSTGELQTNIGKSTNGDINKAMKRSVTSASSGSENPSGGGGCHEGVSAGSYGGGRRRRRRGCSGPVLDDPLMQFALEPQTNNT
jgi:hypothetical protein